MNTSLAHRSTTPTKIESQVDFILLDASSSMTDKWWDSLAAIDAYVDGLKAANIKSKIMLSTFGGPQQVGYLSRNEDISAWKPLMQDQIGFYCGSTALYDAIAFMGRSLRDLDPPRASLVIVTDGDENASMHTDMTQAKAILDWCRAKGWQVTFIGADFANSKQASLLGGDVNSAIGVQMKYLTDAAKSLAVKRGKYGLYGTPMHWSEDEQQQFGGYLAAPEAK